ncbi:MAG: methylenetetrahydrofolate reductase [NAD(P)H] [Gilliamella sp.]|uniref:methylenetetrahydrofolate reductase [NAD(P)H] n=1 Tax=Gilliamella sp. TaxID=1891236 RepID=UPI0025E2720D|nr:methylenetetrahydrofolate reductase [NAD(P)H] [Gilliamella sp.]MCO6545954.1 methylenetetrahydrofolate reductase [NAD(P)H] [Gilliamella sp.]MCO6546374.1 methylenetetrahydrofolate reductase [NAD(P)H] [Gilliamella sp.]
MKTNLLFNKKTVFSFEVFPPKKNSPLETIYSTLRELGYFKPDFISVTYGAGGSLNGQTTIDIAHSVKHTYGIESVAHLPGINFDKAEMQKILHDLKCAGIDNVLALRGDISPNVQPKDDFRYASELVTFIKENGDFNVIGACYPEGHLEAATLKQDLIHLKEKVNAGTDQLISQLFFDNDYFYTFLDKARDIGINVPIEAGIMPVTNKNQIERMVSMCGVNLPKKFKQMMEKYEHHPEAFRDAGIAYAIDQIVDLVSQDVDGIHLYTMNNSYIARRISEAVSTLLAVPKSQ